MSDLTERVSLTYVESPKTSGHLMLNAILRAISETLPESSTGRVV